MNNVQTAAMSATTKADDENLAREAKKVRDQRRVMLHMPVDVRSVSLAIIAAILILYALQWAKEIVVPILMGVLVSYSLTPLVDKLERWRVPRAAAATAVLTLILGVAVWGVFALSDQTDALLETVPKVTQKIREMTERISGKASTIEKVQRAATELAAAAEASGAGSSAPLGKAGDKKREAANSLSIGSAPAAKPIDIRHYLWSGTLGVLAFLGQIAVVFFLALFLMSAGSNFRRKMVKLAGPRLSQKKVTVETLDEITEQIQRYLLVQLGVSLFVGIATWLVFLALGMKQPVVWGVVAAITNLIPYVGAVIVGVGSAVVGLVQFAEPGMGLLVGASSFAIHTVIGNVLTPWWMGKASRMSPVAVFVAVLVFGWLWGIAGLLLGVPILLVFKSVCDRVEDLKPIGELLGS